MVETIGGASAALFGPVGGRSCGPLAAEIEHTDPLHHVDRLGMGSGPHPDLLAVFPPQAAQGAGAVPMLRGGVLGMSGGVAVGFVAYRWLVKIPAKHLFSVTSWLLVLLAAGMASQGVGYLVAADMVPALGTAIWDTSRILSERSIFGQLLHTLIGYDARPSGIQIVVYLSTLAAIAAAMRVTSGPPGAKKVPKKVAGATAVAALLVLTSHAAFAGTKVYSPIDGVAGIAQAQVGDLVGTSTLLTTVSQVDPIKVSFPVSEKLYLHFASQLNAIGNPQAKPSPRIDLILGDGSVYRYPGRLSAVNRQVDVQTGTITMQALFPNPENVLRPGMYAKVRAQTDVQHNALLVPQTAVSSIQGQYEVAVVGTDNRVTLRPVTPGMKTGSLWVIDEGLKPGERVVADGVMKVREGMEVKPVLATGQTPLMSGTPAAGPNPVRQE